MTTFWRNTPAAITGRAGFIGSNLARELLQLQASVCVIDNLERGQLNYLKDIQDKTKFIKADLRNTQETLNALQEARILSNLATDCSQRLVNYLCA